jgi:hypothetical protein
MKGMNAVTAELEMGHNARLEHQRVITDLIIGLGNYYNDHKIHLEPLPETDLDPGNPTSKCPDIQLRDNEQFTIPIVIEIAGNFGYKADFAKARNLLNENVFGIEEVFVYNYEAKSWYKYSSTTGNAEENRSYSDLLQLDLNKFLRLK